MKNKIETSYKNGTVEIYKLEEAFDTKTLITHMTGQETLPK